ncbi:alcohol dehydrogenase catalytic domain-containing protein [Xanthobacter autotrophicus]|uniref:alcohol dehydrogenase catalytic domain-containing protein n=1 Tax=Xanthobacter autotrophicus TaxID=280 RepID=UPI00372BFF83
MESLVTSEAKSGDLCRTPRAATSMYRCTSTLPDPSFPEHEGKSVIAIKAYGAFAADQPLKPLDITRRTPGADDVQIDIVYRGVCHSDLHQVRSEWGGTIYPCVPGHEIVGHSTAVSAP